ncbi:MAG: hypothetical protein IT169_04055 [Bryobacterales bacterium]|nr:hypothetical protein [Bryobacterales bacterium]
MAEFRYPAKLYLLTALLGVMTLVYSVTRLAEAKDYEDTLPFRVQIARLAGVKQRIASERMVGYLSDLDPEHSAYAQLYFPTQYVLAPTLLVPLEDDPGTKFVLGNFTRQGDYAAVGREHGLEIVVEFPMGVVLYRVLAEAPASGEQAHPGR